MDVCACVGVCACVDVCVWNCATHMYQSKYCTVQDGGLYMKLYESLSLAVDDLNTKVTSCKAKRYVWEGPFKSAQKYVWHNGQRHKEQEGEFYEGQ